MERTIIGKGMITNASKIGEHTLIFRKDKVMMTDMGGLFVDASATELSYKKELHQISISRLFTDRLSATGRTAEGEKLFSFSSGMEFMFKLLSVCDYYHDFMMFSDISDDEGGPYTLMKVGEEVSFVEVSHDNASIHLVSDPHNRLEIRLSDVQEILNNGNCLSYIRTSTRTYELMCSSQIRQLLDHVQEIIGRLHELGKMSDQITLKGKVGEFFAYVKDENLRIYELKSLNLKHAFSLRKLKIYLGSHHVVLKHGDDIVCASNQHAKLLCMQTGVIPTRLYALSNARLITHKKQTKYRELLLWREDDEWTMFNPTKEKLVKRAGNQKIRMSKENPRVVILEDGLLSSGSAADFLEAAETLKILMTTTGYPLFFERLYPSAIRISIPGKILWESPVKAFYDAKTHQVGDDVIVQLDEMEVEMPLQMYKGTYTQSLLDLKTPSLSGASVTALMTSRARNLSDVLMYEFFGQWQILLDYMSSFMDQDEFSEEEIKNYGLFMYQAIYQQRKRMEEISSRFPQFMLMLSNEIGTGDNSIHIYQKQQRQLFQLSAQLKSQFIELENLLSQITYVHFHNGEYQKRIEQAYREGSLKKAGGAIVAGIGVTVLTGGVGLILPAMTLFSEWANTKQRNELNEIQKEKEFQKNEFLFKKALDLIRHMDSFTINYHVDVLNQFTFENLQLEAREIMNLNPDHVQKQIMLRQSVHLYTKTSLPADFNQKLMPQQIITSILEKPSMQNGSIESLFLN
ncbi:hypothetical protein [Exiguobacterium sp. RIT341]|uniref:hypothetical protein n=1 Tax=Exiguobacterium sp. RIT341 TaxID=1470592 RepID=UPI000449E2FA|nr:hypothetical protein [Exiguobacterium sp. RIT341]EZP58372.1 hypothetical protein BW42_03054 [Exiguobacterium sp. RIT341]